VTAETVGAAAARDEGERWLWSACGPSTCVTMHLQRFESCSMWSSKHCLISALEWPPICRQLMISSRHGWFFSARAAATSAGSSPIDATGPW